MAKPFRLSPKQKELVAIFADHSMPRDGPYQMGAADLPMAERVELLLGRCALEVQIGVKITLFLLEWLTWYVAGRFLTFGPLFLFFFPALRGRFSKMDWEARDAFLRHWKEHKVYLLRTLFLSLNSVCQMVFYSDPRVMDAIGFDGYKQGVNAFSPDTPRPSAELLASQSPAGRSKEGSP